MRELVAHPSRRAQGRAPQDEGGRAESALLQPNERQPSALSHTRNTSVIPLSATRDLSVVKAAAFRISPRLGNFTGPKPGFLQMLRPQNVGLAAQKTITFFKPPQVVMRDGVAVPPPTLGRMGPLEVRLACDKRDVKRAQKLRYKVFDKVSGRAIYAVMSFGGFLGIGAKPVAVATSELQFMRDEDGDVHAVTSWTKDQLKKMPEHRD
eukprot:gene35279-47408_t